MYSPWSTNSKSAKKYLNQTLACRDIKFQNPGNQQLREPLVFILPAQPQQFPLSFCFFFLSGNTSFSHTFLYPILTKLDQSDQYLNHYSGSDSDGIRGHNGVTGVKKVIFTKKASSPTEYLASMRDLCICISLTPSTKVMVL